MRAVISFSDFVGEEIVLYFEKTGDGRKELPRTLSQKETGRLALYDYGFAPIKTNPSVLVLFNAALNSLLALAS